MALKAFKPNTNGTRNFVAVVHPELHKGDPERSLTAPLSKKGGRNNNGRVTARHQGGGHKRLYRLVDFKRDNFGVKGKVSRIEYDPNRTAYIALLHYTDGTKAYIIAPNRLKVGMNVISGVGAGGTSVIERWAMKSWGVAPCQCSSPSGVNTTSPDRSSSISWPRAWMRPRPSVT